MNLKFMFEEKPIFIIQIILLILFFIYFISLIYIKTLDENYIKLKGKIVEQHIFVEIKEEEIKKIPLNDFDNKIYNEGELVNVVYNKKTKSVKLFKFFEYYKGIFFSFILCLFLSFISFKDYKELKNKFNRIYG